jgi:hypothetical protein
LDKAVEGAAGVPYLAHLISCEPNVGLYGRTSAEVFVAEHIWGFESGTGSRLPEHDRFLQEGRPGDVFQLPQTAEEECCRSRHLFHQTQSHLLAPFVAARMQTQVTQSLRHLAKLAHYLSAHSQKLQRYASLKLASRPFLSKEQILQLVELAKNH